MTIAALPTLRHPAGGDVALAVSEPWELCVHQELPSARSKDAKLQGAAPQVPSADNTLGVDAGEADEEKTLL